NPNPQKLATGIMPSQIKDILQALQGPLQSMISNHLGSQVASQIGTQIASLISGGLSPSGIISPQSIPSIISSMLSGNSKISMPIQLSQHSEPKVVSSFDNLRIVSVESSTPTNACLALALKLGAYSPENL